MEAAQPTMSVDEKLEQEKEMLKFFRWDHLPKDLQEASMPFCDLAKRIVLTLPRKAERTVALRKLLEGKDAAVRCLLP